MHWLHDIYCSSASLWMRMELKEGVEGEAAAVEPQWMTGYTC